MKKILFLIVILAIFLTNCTSVEDKYTEKVKPLLKDFNNEINNLSYLYLNIEKNTPDKEVFFDIQTNLYNIKLSLLKINTPTSEEYVKFSDTFLKTIEDFELLTYKMSNLVDIYNDKHDIEMKLDKKTYSSKEKYYEKKLSITENLIEIQKNDIKTTVNNCRNNLTSLKKISNSLFQEDINFPEFLFKL